MIFTKFDIAIASIPFLLLLTLINSVGKEFKQEKTATRSIASVRSHHGLL